METNDDVMQPDEIRDGIAKAVAHLQRSGRGFAAIKQLVQILSDDYVPVGLDGKNTLAYLALIETSCKGYRGTVLECLEATMEKGPKG